ncbi:Glutamyl-Q tRNA(Asp) synthetase [Ephemeroptericola cinctiostellae]|uniref:Glutamyl-Q tRNA(Asp) synthetase n=1 Tax=Ephemeroptericola cinctiostellae TaxID=2268024 RepID=A0A345D9R7_9BURK|nr:tRNA glutamyl-Q(34) synthetase GluQRS [Ephemeroptericola cinctiostellae]AXF85105.1 Glutamyl-Q tRNA(Asp) synthetase [Ephemeroptericola cinctiostellae]
MHKSINHPHLPQPLRPDSWLACAWLAAKRFKSTPNRPPYKGRFAPSPSGLLHQGSLIAALASYIHAHWHGGEWLVRMEDVDQSRCTAAYGEAQLTVLRELGFEFDANVMWQSQRHDAYQAAFDMLSNHRHTYPCTCTRRDIADSRTRMDARNAQTPAYAGTCRKGINTHAPIRSWRFRVHDEPLIWQDENGIMHVDNLEHSVGDFALKRASLPQGAPQHTPEDGDWTYQLAVVVDDAAQGVTHIVRGEDLLDSTARQIALQRALNIPPPHYNHIPLLLNPDGDKLSKRDQAPALNALHGLEALQHAWCFLGGQPIEADYICDFWQSVFNWAPK